MNRAFIILSVFILSTQCTENESEKIVLPKLISASATVLGNSQGYRLVEFKGKFSEGQDPVKDIKLAWGVNTTTDINPKSLLMTKNVDLLDSNTFKVELETDTDYAYRISFYFISENTATYSETYAFAVVDNKPVFVQIFP